MFLRRHLVKKALVATAAMSTARDSMKAKVEVDLKDLQKEIAFVDQLFANADSASLVDGLEKMSMPLEKDWGIVNHLMGVNNNEGLREVHKALQGDVVETTQKLGQSKKLYGALIRAKAADNWCSLDEAQRRIIEKNLLSMQHSGVGLPAEQQEKFNALQQELASLSSSFRNNVMDSTKLFKYVITDPKDMEGVPHGARTLLSQRAVSAGHANSTAESGPWIVTLDHPSFQACMQHIPSSEIREAAYRAYVARASGESSDRDEKLNNTPIISRILQIKQETSRMLGYQNFAEKSLATKMAEDVDEVHSMIHQLREASVGAARQDLREVEAFAKEHCGFPASKSLALWDFSFYSERLRESRYGYKEEDLKVYFSLENVLPGLFALAEKLFGVVIEPVATTSLGGNDANEAVEVWHPDVRFFHIKDQESGKLISAFFLDPYARAENKNGGAWMDVCLQRSKLMNQTPVAYLVCNGSPPMDNKPALMTFREVETLFHEFGHGLQHMLTTVEHAEASGIAGVEWDAVELPSQFMENWCYDTKTLKQFAVHYETKEVIPDEYIEKLKASKNFLSGHQMLRQLYFAALDMKLHTSEVPESASTNDNWIYDIQKEIASQYTITPPLPNDRFLNGFSHIFGGGYAAGYYSYKYAEVMSADAFAAFEEVGLDNTEAVKALGRKFRSTVLSCGGGVHPAVVYKKFRGRAPTVDALLRHSGLQKQ